MWPPDTEPGIASCRDVELVHCCKTALSQRCCCALLVDDGDTDSESHGRSRSTVARFESDSTIMSHVQGSHAPEATLRHEGKMH